jgi:hypothetical protein
VFLYPRTRYPIPLPAREKRSSVPIGTSQISRFSLVKWLLLVSVFFNGYAISANAQEADLLTVDPTSYDFGYVQTEQASESQTFTLSNNGDDLLWVRFIDEFGNVTTTVDEWGNVTTSIGYQTFDASGNPTTVSEFRLIEDNCSDETLNAERQCELSITFEPQTVGTKRLDLPIPYTDADGNLNSLMLPLTGNSVDYPIPNAEASIMSHDFGNLLVGESSRYQTIKVSNSGSRLSELNVGQLSLSDTSNFVLQDSCSDKSLRRTSSSYAPWCRLSVAFRPQSGGVKTATLSIPSADPDMPVLEISLLGESIAPVPNIEVTPTSLSFDDLQVGSASLYQSLAISNTGTGPLTLGTLNFSGDTGDFELLIDSCSDKTIAANKRCYLNIRFKPQAIGAKSATLSIPSDDADTPTANVSLSGNALGACQGDYYQNYSSYPRSSVDFGTELVGNSTMLRYMRVQYSARGCDAIKIETIEPTGTNASEFQVQEVHCYDGSWNDYSYSSCYFHVIFTPTSVGNKVAELTTTFNDGSTGTWAKPQLQGIAVTEGEPNIEVSPSSHDFGLVSATTYSNQTFTVTNTGNVNLDLDLIRITGQDNTSFNAYSYRCLPYYNQWLAPSNTCQIYTNFTPTSGGNKQANLTITSDDPDTPTLDIPLTGTAEEPLDCSDDNITIESSNTGNWTADDPDIWTRLQNPLSGGIAAPNRPIQQDVVRIKAGHIITADIDYSYNYYNPYIRVRALCIEQNATLQSSDDSNYRHPYLFVFATDAIENLGTIKGLNGADETDSSSCNTNNWYYWGRPDCAQAGAGIYLRVSYILGRIRNEGRIIAGHGGKGQRYGAPGGWISIYGAGITNTDDIGYIEAGRGGDLTGTQSGLAGRGGGVWIWGYDYLMSDGRGIDAGNGGNCNPNATEAQTGGNGGNMALNARNTVDLLAGTFATGDGGQNCEPLGTNGQDGQFWTDPSILNLAGTNTRVEGGDITIFGGDDWNINLNNLSDTALTATGDITIAVGPGGSIDMTGNSASILKAGGQLTVLADTILLDDGVELSDIVEANNIVIGPGTILRNVSVTAPDQISGEAGTTVPITITLSNGGPASDTFLISLTDTAGWSFGDFETRVELEGLDTIAFTLDVTLPDTANASNTISVTATSESDPEANATATIQAMVTEAVSGRATIDYGILDVPGTDIVVDGGNVAIIAAAEEGRLDLSNLGDSNAVTATGDITLAVGPQGIIDLRGNTGVILKTTNGRIIISVDDPFEQIEWDGKYEGVSLETVLATIFEATEIVFEGSKPSYSASLTTGASELSKPAGSILALTLTLENQGLNSDAYTLSVTDTLGLPLSGIPPIKRVKGLDSVELLLNVGLIATAGATDVITVTATSQTDSSVVATTTVSVTMTEPPIPFSPTVVVPSTSPLCQTTNGVVNRLCRNDGQVLTSVTIEAGTSIAGGQLTGTVTNNGLISQVTIKENAIVTGGKLTGYIVNEGTLENFEFVGARIEGGTLSGPIRNNSQVGGVFKDVRLAADTRIIGGAVQGDVEGDAEAPAVLDNVTIKSGTQLSNVILSGSTRLEGFVTLTNVQFAEGVNLSGGKLFGDFGGAQDNLIRLENTSIRSGSRLSYVIIGNNVEIAEDVVFGEGVRFANLSSLPSQQDLMGTLPELPAVEIAGVTYPSQFDLSADVSESGDGLLNAINELAFFKDNGWTITQNSELGYLELTLDTIRYAVLPASVQKLATSIVGMELQEALSVNFNMESGLSVFTHPALQAPSVLQSALADFGLNELLIQDNGNLQIPSEDGIWYSARPDWLSTELVDVDAEAGMLFGESPYLGGLFSVSMRFDAGEGSLREQVMSSAVAYPEALYSSATNVSIGAYGLVNFVLDGEAYRGVIDYVVTQGTPLTTDTIEVDVEASSDMNGDEIDDFVLNYSTGEQQILFALP